MSIKAFTKWALVQLGAIATAQLDTEVLIADALKQDRSWVLAHPEQKLSPVALKRLRAQIKLRATHQPLAYIRGKTEFYARGFIINADVLEPRSESETMIDLLKDYLKSKPELATARLLDVGTGSGALAITAKLELANLTITATDIDPKCLAVAQQNSKLLNAQVEFIKADLLDFADAGCDIILANLPYVPDAHRLNEAAMNEPRQAIFGGLDGLDHYRRFFDQLSGLSLQPRLILTESLPTQHPGLNAIACKYNYQLERAEDFIQQFILSDLQIN